MSRWSAPSSETKLLGCFAALEYLAGVVDADDRVQRCVKDQERLPQRADTLGRALLFQILQKLLSHRELAPGERHLGLAFGVDFLPRLREEVTDVGGIERGADRRNGLRLRHVLRGREYVSTAERMADQPQR